MDDENPTNPCYSEPTGPCGYYGDCSVLTNNSYECLCDEHWIGENCTEYVHCDPNPCLSGGHCVNAGNHFVCECQSGFSGKLCEKSPCEPSPCGIGVCSIGPDHQYICDCTKTNAFGNQCEYQNCQTISCGEHGAIISIGGSVCTCECQLGFSGPNCNLTEETNYGQQCKNNSDCWSEAQYCNSESNQCDCNLELGFILDEFQPSLTYGQCIGPVPVCETSDDCEFGQTCSFGFCACLDGQLIDD